MIGLLLVISLIVLLLSFFEEYLGKYKYYIYIGIGFILIFLASTREVGLDHDSENYEYFFLHYDDPFISKSVEPTFYYLSNILYKLFGDVHSLFFIYAFLGISTKMLAIKKMSPILYLPLLIYLSNYYMLHDLTQIRAGVASGFFMLSLYYYLKDRKWIALSFIIVAIFFHYSAVSLLPLFLLSNKELTIKQRYIWGAVVPLGYIIYFTHIDLIASIPIPYISNKIEIYKELTERGIAGNDQINVFNMVFLVRIVIFYYVLFFYDTIKEKAPSVTTILKIEALGIAFFPAFAQVPAIAFRLSELYCVVDIFAYTYIVYTVKQKRIGITIVNTIGIVLLLINLFYIKLLS